MFQGEVDNNEIAKISRLFNKKQNNPMVIKVRTGQPMALAY